MTCIIYNYSEHEVQGFAVVIIQHFLKHIWINSGSNCHKSDGFGQKILLIVLEPMSKHTSHKMRVIPAAGLQ